MPELGNLSRFLYAAARALAGAGLFTRFRAGRSFRLRPRAHLVAKRGNFSRFLVVAALADAGLFALCEAGRSLGLRPSAQVMAELGNRSRFLVSAARALAGTDLLALLGAGRSFRFRPLAHAVVECRDGFSLGRIAGRALVGLDARFATGRRRLYRAVVPGVFSGRGDLPRFLVGAAGALAGAGLLALRAAGRGLRHRPRAHVVAELGDGLGLGLGAAGLCALIHRGAVRIARRRRGRPGVPDVVMRSYGNSDRARSSHAARDFVFIQIAYFDVADRNRGCSERCSILDTEHQRQHRANI